VSITLALQLCSGCASPVLFCQLIPSLGMPQVVAGICPFNFPAMIPLWMFPMAVTAGNTFVLKPSEKDPGAAMMLAELVMEAGLPKGVLNIVHGTHDTVNGILDHPDIKAVSFVGSDAAGKYIYQRAAANGKRVQVSRNAGIGFPSLSVGFSEEEGGGGMCKVCTFSWTPASTTATCNTCCERCIALVPLACVRSADPGTSNTFVKLERGGWGVAVVGMAVTRFCLP
jgi:Aldehyde dehydrogenase family